MTKQTDKLYAHQRDVIGGFQFNDAVAAVFPDMIQRSVPGYATILHMIGQLAERYAQPNTAIYDLGCSLGGATLAMRHRVNATGTQIYGVDNSQAMIDRCQSIIDADAGTIPVELVCDSLQQLPLKPCSVSIMNFVLQFITLEERMKLLQVVAQATLPGGIFVLSEKISFTNYAHNELMIELHHNFKRANGYSDLEIAQKRTALENVLIPETLETHRARLLEAGFKSVDCWFQCFNFMSLVALK